MFRGVRVFMNVDYSSLVRATPTRSFDAGRRPRAGIDSADNVTDDPSRSRGIGAVDHAYPARSSRSWKTSPREQSTGPSLPWVTSHVAATRGAAASTFRCALRM